jgi:hypothetical protein
MSVRLLLVLAIAAASPALAQEPIPRTPDGRPDFSGTWTSAFTPQAMERVAGATTLVVSEEEANKLVAALQARRAANKSPVYDPDDDTITVTDLPRIGGEWRTSVVTEPADGKLPLTPEWRGRAQQNGEFMQRHGRGLTLTEGPEELPYNERCFGGAGRAPLSPAPIEVLRQIVQTADHLMIYSETLFGETRIARIGARPAPAAIVSFNGDSIARWEGDELVVETTGMSDARPVRGGSIVVRANARVTERFSLTSADTILYRFTVEDPQVYTAAWSAEFELGRSGARIFESACHEANYGLANILSGARETERRAAVKPRP